MATEGVAMGRAIVVRTDDIGPRNSPVCEQAKNVAQARRLLAIAAVLERRGPRRRYSQLGLRDAEGVVRTRLSWKFPPHTNSGSE
jgi:hypothetical protein